MEAEARATPKSNSLNVLCEICNEVYKVDDNIVSTASCGHIFHKDCLYRTLTRSRRCPLCGATCHRQRVHRVYLSFAARTELDEMECMQIQWIPIDLEDPHAMTELFGAIQCGTDHDGFDTYVARVALHNDLLPANYVPQKKVVYTPWGCSAHRLDTQVDLLVLQDCDIRWVPAENGYVPPNALQTGYSELGEHLYTGRAVYQDLTILGKVHPSHKLLYMPFGSEEVSSSSYEVLVLTPREHAER